MTVIQKTKRDARGITYSVEVDGAAKWMERVLFERRGSRAAGGSAFRQAARRQERETREAALAATNSSENDVSGRDRRRGKEKMKVKQK